MCGMIKRPGLTGLALLVMVTGQVDWARAKSKDLGNGYWDHGVAAPISNHRGMVGTVDGDGRDVVVLWLMDHRGGYGALEIDTATGKTKQVPMPFDSEGDSPYASILSSGKNFYTHFNSHFVEYDPRKKEFTFCQETSPQMAMGMTEDDQGVIWSVTYPQSGVVSFNPKTREFHDYGQVYAQNWSEYPRYVAADDAGWIYFGLGMTASQIVALDPKSGKAMPMLQEQERKKGVAYVYRDVDGKVYGQAQKGEKDSWYEFYKGAERKIERHQVHAKSFVAGDQNLNYLSFTDGMRATSVNLVDRKLTMENTRTGKKKEISFDYSSDGAIVMGVEASPDGTASGGTTFPMRSFSYDSHTDKMSNRAAYGQWNATTVQGGHFLVGGYPGGFLLDWDVSKPWVATAKGKMGCNPEFLIDCDPDLHRPTKVFALPDGHSVIMAGTPQYGYTGGGLLFWDRASGRHEVLGDGKIMPDESTESMVLLPGKKLLAGTTTEPGTGGEKKAKQAQLYVMDLATKKVEWHEQVLEGVQSYTDMTQGPRGLIYGVADCHLFFAFDPVKREVVYQHDTMGDLGRTASQQGPRVFVNGPDGEIYMVFVKGIARVDQRSHAITLLAESPVPAEVGGDYLDGRVYFVSGSHVCSK